MNQSMRSGMLCTVLLSRKTEDLTCPTSLCATDAPACLSVAPSMYFPATAAADQHIRGQEQQSMQS